MNIFTLSINCYYNDFTLLIFDRWGQILYETSNPYQKWDGRAESGKLLENGVYPYLIKMADDTNLIAEEITGHVTLLR